MSGSTLEGGNASVDGTFQWQNTAQNVTRDVNLYAAEFVPNNTNWYNTVSFNVEVEILKTPQTITWNRADSTGVRTIDQVVLDATAGSGLPVKYTSSDQTVATIDSMMVDAQKVYFVHAQKGGTVTITASQAGDETYAEAPSVAKKITFNRVIPVISTAPVPTAMYIHHFLSNSTPENGEATVDGNKINGTFTWEDPTELMDVPGENDRVVVFTPYNQDLYTTQTCTLTVEVQRFAPTIVSTTLDTDPANYGTALKDLHLIGSWYAVDHTDPARPRIEGTIDWKNPNDQVAVDVTSAVMVFYPTHAEWYDEVEFNVPVHLAKIAVVNPTAAATIVYGQALTDAQFVSTTTDPISGNRIYGTVVLDESVDMTQYCIEGSHTFPMMFTPNSVNYTSDAVAGIATVTVTPGVVFNGNNGNSWAEKTNWLDNEKPTTTDRVTVNANVEVSGDVTIGGLTINEGKTVVVKDGATLTIGDQDSYMRSNGYGNLKVENGGKVIFNGGEVKVNDFILEAKLGDIDHPAVSGQVNGPEALNVTGEAYFDLVLDQRGACTPGWYDFSVPFPVDVMTGVVARYNMDGTLANDNLRNETEYAIMAHYEEIHATGQYAWKKFRGVMQSGVCYTMTINATSPIYRFKKAQGAEIVSHNALPLSFTDSEQGATTDKGWNAMGNGLLTFANLDVANTTKIQLYDHTTNSYSSHRADSVTFTVGSAFRIQAKAESLLDLNQALEARDILRAPGRRTAEVEEEELTIRLHANGRMEDQLFISASEDALDEYEIGHDLVKQGTMTDSKIGRIWCDAYGLKLCDAELTKNDAGTYFPIGFYSPKATSYTLSVGANNSETEVWLTCDGAPVWNLSESAYELNLTKGTNLSYALRLVDAPRQTPTDIEETGEGVQVKGARKLMIDGKLFIIRDGQTFDGVGRKVK